MEKVKVVRILPSAETANPTTHLVLSNGKFQEKVELCEMDESWLSRPVFPQDKTLAQLAFLTYKDKLHETFFSSDLENKLLAFSTYENDLQNNISSSNQTQDQSSISSEQHLKETLAKISKEWQLLTTARNERDGYFGAAFWNATEQQLVFSHRGTNPTEVKALLADIEGIMRNQHTSQIDSACTFVMHVLRELSGKQRFKQIQISITGHSLGAWLAQVTAFSTEYLTIDREMNKFRLKSEEDLAYHAHTVGFESPGCRRMLTKLCEMFHRRYEKPEHNFWTNLDITLYLTRPNMVNTCCKHVGKLYQVDITPFVRNTYQWLNKYTAYTLHYHRMESIAMAMSINDNGVRLIHDWPLVVFAERMKDDGSKPLKYLDYAFIKLLRSLPSLIYDSITKSNQETNEFWDCSNSENSFSPEPDKNMEWGIRLHYKVGDIATSMCHLNTFSKVEQLFLFCWPSETTLRVDLKNEIKKELPNFKLDKHDSLFENFFYIENKCQQIECANFIANELINFTKQLFRFLVEPRNYVQNLARVTKTSVSICKKFSDSYLQQTIVQGLEFKDTIGLEAFLSSNELGNAMWIATGFQFEIQRIFNILKLYKVKYIFLDLTQVNHLNNYLYFSETIKSLTDHVIVLDCQRSNLNEKDLNLLKRLFANNSKLKTIVVAQCDLAQSVIREGLKNDVQFMEHDAQLHLNDLTSESNAWLRNKMRDKIMLQGKNIDVFQLIGQSEALDSEIVVELIKEDKIFEIGSEPMKLWQSEASYAKRLKFIQVETLINAFKNDSIEQKNEIFVITSSNDFSFEQLLKIDNEIDKKKLMDSTCTFDPENENIEYNTCKKLNVLSGGKESDFKRLCSYNSDKVVFWLEIINQQFYLHQIYNKSFYIKRHLFHCSGVSINRSALLLRSSNERFVLCGIKLHYDLENRINRNIFSSPNKNEAQNKYNSWCTEAPETPVHWVHWFACAGNELFWQQSHFSIKQLRDYVDTVYTQKMGERSLANLKDKVVVIVAEPGMGKSTTLTHLSEYKVDDSWVIRLDLKDHQEQILCLPDDYSDTFRANESIVKFLMNVSHINNCTLSQILLTYSLTNSISRSLLILFDGYDEIEKVHQEKLIQLMRYLKVNTFAKVWITSRKHCTLNLEDQLCVFSTTFKELTLDERLNFLKCFWQVRLRLELSEAEYNSAFGNSELSKFNIFSTALLEKVDKVLDEKMSKFMGIPLQMRLLAENFLPDFERFIKSCRQEVPKFEGLNVTQIYQRFINAKFRIYFEEKSRLSVGLNEVLTKWFSDDLIKRHQYLAFQLLFPDKINLLLELESSVSEKDLEIDENEEIGLKRIGLIHSSQTTGLLEFIHRTFAEYFISTLFLNWLRKPCHSKTFEGFDRLLKAILSRFDVICSFLDEQIIESDVTRVKSECISEVIINVLYHACANKHVNLIKYILSFFNNKIWLLIRCYSYLGNFFHHAQNSHNLEIAKCFLTLIINHVTVFYTILFKTSALYNISSSLKEVNGKMLMNAIKCRTKIMEDFVKYFYLDDLLELCADDEGLCQLMKRLMHDETNGIGSKIYKMNQLMNAVRDTCDLDRHKIRSKMYLITDKTEYDHISVALFYNYLSNFFGLFNVQKPREAISGFHLFSQLNDFMIMAIIVERLKNDNFRIEKLREELEMEKEYDNELRQFLEKSKFELFYIANQLKNEVKVCEYLELFINVKELPELVALSKSSDLLVSNEENESEKQSNDDIDVGSDDEDEIPKIFFCFEDYRDYFEAEVQNELDAAIQMKFLFQHKNKSNLLSIFPSSFSNRIETFLSSYNCDETKLLLFDFIHISAIVHLILNDTGIKTLFETLMKKMEDVQTWLDVLRCLEQYSKIEDETDDPDLDYTIVEVEIFKNMFQLLAISKEIDFYRAVEAMDSLLLKRMLLIYSKHFTGIFFLFVFKLFQCKSSSDLYYFQNKYSLILEFVWKTFPDVALCLVTWDYILGEYTHLGYAVAYNSTNDISLLFRILKAYPRILEQLLLTPLNDSDQCCLRCAIVDSKLKTLKHFLEELNRNTEVMGYVIESFICDEKGKLHLFEEAEVKNPGALLIFLNNLKIDDLLIDFLLPADADEKIKPAFYLAGERGCKEVMDTLLSALVSEPDTLWELLTWTEADTGQTVLHRACERGYVEISDALFNSVREQPEQIKTLFFTKDASQHTALDFAVLSERQYIRKNFNNKDLIDNANYKIVRESFADESCVEKQIESLQTISRDLVNVPVLLHLILVIAKSFNNAELMLAIFENADLSSVLESTFIALNTCSYHLFECAIQRNSLELVERLVNMGVDMNYTDGYGFTPLMRAVHKNRLQIVKFFLESGVDVYANDMNGTTAIALANEDERNFDMIGLFLKFV